MSFAFKRIISLVPSLTELLIDLGLEERIVGRTRFCIHPEGAVEEIPVIGGTKNLRMDKIREQSPDFIIANIEENRKEQIQELAEDFYIHLTNIATIEDALIAIHNLGEELEVADRARGLAQQISEVLQHRPEESLIRAAYLIWKDPWMTIGKDTYIHDVLTHWNLENVFGDDHRYPKITLSDLADRHPELVLLSSEPYPFREKHIAEVEEMLPQSRILLAEGEWFSWYGSHMLHSFKRLNIWRKAIA